MSKVHALGLGALLIFLASTLASASSVVKIRIDDTIQPVSDEYIGRAIEQARQTNADAVLIELRTPGGLVDSTAPGEFRRREDGRGDEAKAGERCRRFHAFVCGTARKECLPGGVGSTRVQIVDRQGSA